MDIATKSKSSKKSRFAGTNLNAQLKPTTRRAPRLARSGSTKLEVLEVRPRLSKLKKKSKKKTAAIPKPLNTPSQSHAHNGQDPTINIIAQAGGAGWGQDVKADNTNAQKEAAAAQPAKPDAASSTSQQGASAWAAPAPAAQAQPERPRRGLSDFNPFDRSRNRQPAVVSDCAVCTQAATHATTTDVCCEVLLFPTKESTYCHALRFCNHCATVAGVDR